MIYEKKITVWAMVAIASFLSLNSRAQLSGYYQEDFEGIFPPPGWQTVNVLDTNNVWEQSSNYAYSAYYSAHINYTSNIDIDGEDWLILPQFTVASADSFSFWLAVDFVDLGPDQTDILISTTDSNISSFTTTLASLTEGYNYPAVPHIFQHYAYSLAAYAGQNIYVAFKHSDTFGDGVFVDLVSIGNPIQTVDAAALSIDVPDVLSTNTFSPMATVKNNSINTQSFTVTLSSPGYTSAMNVFSLASGELQQITFDPWTPAVGNATLTLTVSLPGDLDVTNDVVTKNETAFEPFVNYGWAVKPAAPSAAYGAASAAMNYTNGTSTLFMLGGSDGNYIQTAANSFDPFDGSWSSLSSFSVATTAASAAAINGKIYLAGDHAYYYTGDNQVYDIATDTWSAGTAMPTAVADYAFGIYNDSLLYYLGGVDLASATQYDLVQIYDPATDSWMNGTHIPISGRGWQSGITGNKIVLSGGYNDYSGYLLSSTYVGTIDPSNPASISWVQVDDYPLGSIFREASGATIDPATGLVVFTGGDPFGNSLTAASSTFAYDVNSDTWKIGPDKPTAANNLRNLSCIVHNDSMYLATLGGYNENTVLDVNEWLNMGPAPLATTLSENFYDNINLVSFPNPFTRFTILTFKLGHAATVRVSIADVTGKEIDVLREGSFSEGDQQVIWNASAYAAGIYFCNVNVDGKVITKKFVKLK